jgi:hypothetical protein
MKLKMWLPDLEEGKHKKSVEVHWTSATIDRPRAWLVFGGSNVVSVHRIDATMVITRLKGTTSVAR